MLVAGLKEDWEEIRVVNKSTRNLVDDSGKEMMQLGKASVSKFTLT
jgi:hypothetical protein